MRIRKEPTNDSMKSVSGFKGVSFPEFSIPRYHNPLPLRMRHFQLRSAARVMYVGRE